MKDVFIFDNYARLNRTAVENCEDQGVRLFRPSPFSAVLQIRTKSARQGHYSQAHLSAADCRLLAANLLEIAAELEQRHGLGPVPLELEKIDRQLEQLCPETKG